MDNDYYRDVEFQRGFKYQVTSQRTIQTKFRGFDIDERYFALNPEGLLTAKIGYSWDGASGCPDIGCIIRGSLFHDVLYQMMRMKLIPRDRRIDADKLLEELCIEDGMWKWVAHYIVYKIVRKLGGPATHPNHRKQIRTAP